MTIVLVDAIKSRASIVARRPIRRIFVAPGWLGADLDRELAALDGTHSVSEEQVEEVQGRQIDVAKKFWASMGFGDSLNSIFWVSDL
jgi:hypothetical protein